MSRTFRVEIGGIQPWMIFTDGDLSPMLGRYIQQPNHYSLFWFEHSGVVMINNRPQPYQPGNVGFIPPGTKFEFTRTGEGTNHIQMTFELIPSAQMVEVQAISDLGSDEETRRRDFQGSLDWMNISIMRGLSCALNTLWSIAKPAQGNARSSLIYEAEDLITEQLNRKIMVADLARELDISHVQLLRLFRKEHGCTIQEYIRSKRADLAVHLITTTSMPIKEIAHRSGMTDLQYFNKVIRTDTGHSPRGLRTDATRRNLRGKDNTSNVDTKPG